MMRRAARVTTVLVLVAVAATAAYQAVARSHGINRANERLAKLSASAAQADLALLEIAAAERGYVAPGQGLDFWTGKADEALASARRALATLSSEASDTEAARQVNAAASRLDDVSVVDQRVRAYAGGGQRAMASDLVFADGYEIIAAARAELASAIAVERAALEAGIPMDRRVHLASIGILGACAVIALLLLLRAPKPAEPLVTHLEAPMASTPRELETARPSARVEDDSIGAALDASLAGLDDVGVNEPALTVEPEMPIERARPARPAEPVLDLTSAADVCVDLGRLLDARDLQAVLARIGTVLGANGLIVWMADQTGASLAPVLTHGYPAALIARLGRLPIDDDNATAAAWRAKSTQVVDGALAAPLLTSAGCTGVLSVELAHGRERDHATQALTRILAAQLAASVAPVAAESRRAAEA